MQEDTSRSAQRDAPQPPAETSQTISFPGQYDHLAVISEFVTRAAEAANLDEHGIYAVQMAVDEACCNIIEHAYGGEGRGDVECSCHVNDEGLTVTLRDHGHPFDPSAVPEPDLQAELEDRDVGGLGLYFMRRLMDEVRFESTPEEGNSVTMVKRREARP